MPDQRDARSADLDDLPPSIDLDDALLGGPRELTLAQLAREAHVAESDIRAYWRALGLPVTEGATAAYTKQDARVLARIFAVAETEQLDTQSLTTLIRSTGHTTERLVLWQVEALVEHLAGLRHLDDASARLVMLDRLPALASVLQEQLIHAWRRQLAAVAGRLAVEFADPAPIDDHQLPLRRAVGFADIVDFTQKISALGPSELSRFVQQFEGSARDIISAHGGRVVKTVGDAVLFVADDVSVGAKIALGLAEAASRSSDDQDLVELAPVRVSLVWGRVLSRFGDVFGASVNLAARLADVAEPSMVLTDQQTANLLVRDANIALTSRPECDLQGLGLVQPVQLQWAYRGE